MTVAFTFDVGFQRAVLRLMMIDEAFAVKAIQYLKPDYFTVPSLGWTYRLFFDYWQTYQRGCTDIPLRDAVLRLGDEHRTRFANEAEMIIACGVVPESDYIKEKLQDFCQQAVFSIAHQESATLFNTGKKTQAYDVMARAQERIADIGFEQEQRVWLFDELQERQRLRWRAQMDPMRGVFTTGLPQLNALCEGGVHLGELWAVFAYAKRCKTTWLINQGFNATRMHQRPTLHLLLEGRLDMISARYDACFSQELYSRVKRGEIDPQLFQALQEEYAGLRRLLVIRKLPGWDNTIEHTLAELHYLKSQGFIPEMMITDYMDLGRKRDPGRNETETSHQIAYARDLKRLHEDRNMAGWSAWQAQRPRKDAHTREHILSESNVADAYAKVRIVDAYGSLNATDEEMDKGEMRYFQEGHRDAPVHKVWTITNDLSRMRMLTSAVEYVPPQVDVLAGAEWTQ